MIDFLCIGIESFDIAWSFKSLESRAGTRYRVACGKWHDGRRNLTELFLKISCIGYHDRYEAVVLTRAVYVEAGYTVYLYSLTLLGTVHAKLLVVS